MKDFNAYELIVNGVSHFIEVSKIRLCLIKYDELAINQVSILIQYKNKNITITDEDLTIEYASELVDELFSYIKEKTQHNNFYKGKHYTHKDFNVPFIINVSKMLSISFYDNTGDKYILNDDIERMVKIENKKHSYTFYFSKQDYFNFYDFMIQKENN